MICQLYAQIYINRSNTYVNACNHPLIFDVAYMLYLCRDVAGQIYTLHPVKSDIQGFGHTILLQTQSFFLGIRIVSEENQLNRLQSFPISFWPIGKPKCHHHQITYLQFKRLNPVSEKNGLSLKVRFYLTSLRVCFPCKEHQRIKAIIQVAQILCIGFR